MLLTFERGQEALYTLAAVRDKRDGLERVRSELASSDAYLEAFAALEDARLELDSYGLVTSDGSVVPAAWFNRQNVDVFRERCARFRKDLSTKARAEAAFEALTKLVEARKAFAELRIGPDPAPVTHRLAALESAIARYEAVAQQCGAEDLTEAIVAGKAAMRQWTGRPEEAPELLVKIAKAVEPLAPRLRPRRRGA